MRRAFLERPGEDHAAKRDVPSLGATHNVRSRFDDGWSCHSNPARAASRSHGWCIHNRRAAHHDRSGKAPSVSVTRPALISIKAILAVDLYRLTASLYISFT